MIQSDKHIPNDENTHLLQTDESKVNSGGKICRKTVPPKRYIRLKNSDGSLDFERIVNLYSIQAKREKLIGSSQELSHHSRKTTRWVLTIACALISGLTTILVVGASEKLVAWRTRILANLLTSSRDSFWYIFGAYCFVSLLLADAAAALCLYWPGIPEAVGSGIPEVKAYLNGVRVKKFNNSRLLVVKMIGSILSVGSSMAVGMEGPLVMIGACAGAALSHCGTTLSSLILKIKELKDQWKYGRKVLNGNISKGGSNVNINIQSIDGKSEPILNWLWVLATSDLSYFANDAEKRKLVTVGAACGFAASFGAPIGGMLFVMDDISSFLDQDIFLRILVANSVGTFCLATFRGNLSEYGAIEFGSYNGDDDNSIGERFHEIPFWIFMGIIGGVLGGYFCKAFGGLKKSSGKKFNTKGLKMLRISYISLLNSIVMFLLPTMNWVCHDNHVNTEAAAERQFFCKDGETNQMAAVFFGSRGKAIVRILSDPGQFYASTLCIVGFMFFGLMLVTNTTAIPSGLFTPIVVSGASLGGAYGLCLQQYVDKNIDPSAFALLGVGAMMAGIQRSTVSTCVILVEGTGQMRILLPVMVVVVIANYVAQLIYEDGIYEVLMKLKGYPYLDHSKDDSYDIYLVRDIMSSSPVTLREKERAFRLVDLLRTTSHNGFPVVDEKGRFKGLVRRKQIVALMECGIFEKGYPKDKSLGNNIFESTSSVQSNSGKKSQGLMHYAYYIKDDRYNYVTEIDGYEEVTPFTAPKELFKIENKSDVSKWNPIKSALKVIRVMNETKRPLGGDITMPIIDFSKIDARNFNKDDDSDLGINGGGDDVDSNFEEDENHSLLSNDDIDRDDEGNSDLENLAEKRLNKVKIIDGSNDKVTKDPMSSSNSVIEAPKGFAKVGRDRKNNTVVITWLNPDYKDDVIDLEAVMNRGTYIVPEYFPLSKAYSLFTLLGLRWIVVVGGIDGGTVVGILTRESFLESYIKLNARADSNNF